MSYAERFDPSLVAAIKLTATDGADALAIYIQRKDNINLVLTDKRLAISTGGAPQPLNPYFHGMTTRTGAPSWAGKSRP